MGGSEQLLARVADAYRLGEVRASAWVARGSMGEVFRLDTAAGPVAAKRLFWDNGDDARVRSEIAFASACRAAGVNSPETLVGPDRAPLFVDIETGDRWRVQEWVDGEVPERTDVPTALWLADQLARIHLLAMPIEPDGYVETWFCRIADGWGDVLAKTDGAGPWARTLAQRADEFRALADLVNAVPMGALVHCHRDALAANTMLAGDGSRSLIDWENHGAMEPWRELGVLLLHHVRSPEAVAAIAARYAAAGGTAVRAEVEVFASGLAIWLNYLQDKALEAVDSDLDPAHRDFAVGRVEGLVTGLPTVDELARAAGAIRGDG